MTDKELEMINKLGLEPKDFEPKSENLEQRIADLEEMLKNVTFELINLNESVTEVKKKQDGELPSGDYLNPIKFVPPMNVEQGKWYYTDEVGFDLPRECIADANQVTDFNNDMVFEWV